MDRYLFDRDVSAGFLDTAALWISEYGEVLVVLRYLRAGGAKDFVICNSRREFETLVAWTPVGTDIEVIRVPQLPFRGIVTTQFIARVQESIPLGAEYLVLTTERSPDRPVSRVTLFDDDRESLEAALRELRGEEVACGVCPNFIVGDHEGLASASKGGIDGPR